MKKKIICFFLFLLVITGGFTAYKYFFIPKNKDEELKYEENLSESIHEEKSDYIEPIDAERYLNEIGEVQKKYDINSSENVLTEKELINILSERGFDEYPVETNYSMDGKYYDSKIISQNSTEKHPMYETYFASSTNSIWYIETVNGSIYASSFSYNFQEDLKVPVILSESDYITSYDSATNQFFEVIPDSDEMIVKVVPKIDAELLESLTIEEIDKL